MSWFEPYKSGYLLRIKLAPGASSCGFRGVFCDANGAEYLKVSVNAVAEKGKANKELQKLLAKTLRLSVGSFELISGATEHLKKIYVEMAKNAENEAALRRLNPEEQK